MRPLLCPTPSGTDDNVRPFHRTFPVHRSVSGASGFQSSVLIPLINTPRWKFAPVRPGASCWRVMTAGMNHRHGASVASPPRCPAPGHLQRQVLALSGDNSLFPEHLLDRVTGQGEHCSGRRLERLYEMMPRPADLLPPPRAHAGTFRGAGRSAAPDPEVTRHDQPEWTRRPRRTARRSPPDQPGTATDDRWRPLPH